MNNCLSMRSGHRNPQSIYRLPVSGSLSSPAVSIPVRFVNIESPWSTSAPARHMDETKAAVVIQSVFRGFCVRKTKTLQSLKVIAGVKVSMEEMRRRINSSLCLELMRQNEKERLKIAEEIMSLLLKLDEIQGVKSFVREARRAVAHELVSLHEKVDAINTSISKEVVTEDPIDLQTREDESCNIEKKEGRRGAGNKCWLRIRMGKIMRRSYWTD